MTTFEDELRAALHDQAQALRVPERPALDPEGVERTHAPEPRRLLAVAARIRQFYAELIEQPASAPARSKKK